MARYSEDQLYRGKTLCHGCGKSGYYSRRRKKDTVCLDCEETLAKGREARTLQPGTECSTVHIPHYTLNERCELGSNMHGFGDRRNDPEFKKGAKLVYLGGGHDKKSKDYRGSHTHILEHYREFLLALDMKVDDSGILRFTNGEYTRDSVKLPTKAVRSLFYFWDALAAYSHRLQVEAFNEGRDLLKSLHDGTMTVQEFDKRGFNFNDNRLNASLEENSAPKEEDADQEEDEEEDY